MNHDPRYPAKSDYATNSPSYGDDLARKTELMKYLAQRIWEYDKELAKRFAQWDENLATINEDVIEMMEGWLADGTLAHIINEVIFADLLEMIRKNEVDIAAIFKQVNDENVYIGLDAGQTSKDTHTSGVDSGNYSNVAVGGFAMTSNFRGWKNTAVGHLALADNTGGYYNVAIGDSALEHNIGDNGQVGTDAADSGARNTALGSYALRYNKSGRGNVGVGRNAGHANESGNYNTAVGTNAYSGSVFAGNNDTPKSADYNSAFGYNALFYTQTGNDNVGIGHHTGYRNQSGHSNVYVGANAGRDGFTSNRCVGIGFEAMTDKNNGSDNVAIGARSMGNFQTVNSSTAIGDNSLLFDMEGNPLLVGEYMVGIGKQSRVSGSYQIQLGTSEQTTYAYGAIQNRSDARDKADIRDTELGLDFINKIRPVDFKWNYRDDYVETYEVKEEVDGELVTVSKSRTLPNDGSKKRSRMHHGVIAQEVRDVMEEAQVEFGGFQDHSINGGNDMLTIGYEEFIAPLIKAVQELTARVETLEKG